MSRSTQLLAAALLLCAPAGLQGQEDSLTRVLESLSQDQPVRVDLWTEAGGTEELVGQVRSWEARSFTVATEDGVRRPGYDRVQRLWVEEGRQGGRGAWIGALVGGGTGALVGGFGMLGADTRELPPAGFVVGFMTLSSAALGTLVGYIVGWHDRDWRLRFDAGDRRVGLRVEAPMP